MADVEAVQDGAVAARLTPSEPGAPVPGPGTSAPPAATRAPGEMSLVDHLVELRNRLVRIVLAVALGSVVGAIFWVQIRDVLLQPLPTGQVQVLGPGDAFMIFLRISVVTGIILAMPVILWQVWAFVAPGLTDSERRTARPWIPLALLFFALGVTIAYFILPMAVGFLLGFTDDRLVGNLAAGPYFDFVTTMFLAFGIVLEFPIVLYGLSRVGIVTSARLASSRRIAVLAIFVFAAGVTPGGDLVSPAVMFVTMYGLYEATIFFIRRSGK